MIRTPYQFASRYEPRGWMHWPEDEDVSLEFMKLLGAAQEGGSTVSECFLAASQIDPRDHESWYREWNRTADANRERAIAALESGNALTARGNLLRATNYYLAAGIFLDAGDCRRGAVVGRMQECAEQFLKLLTPAGKVVEIPWLPDYPLRGYFLPAPSGGDRKPAVICMGEPGQRKEEFLYKMSRYARDREISVLVVDLLGPGSSSQFDQVVGRPDLETSISRCVDYLAERDDVDEQRIAIVGDGAGSSFVARGVALDQRIAAAVCDGGIWDLHERALLINRTSGAAPSELTLNLEKFGRHSIMRKIKCPVLVTLGEHGWLDASDEASFSHYFEEHGLDISMKVFSASETAASHGHFDNPTFANEYIFDWLSDRLGMNTTKVLKPVCFVGCLAG
jgi:dienelactone hydrolase